MWQLLGQSRAKTSPRAGKESAEEKRARRPNPGPLPQLAGTRTWLPHTPFFVLARASGESPVPPLLPATPRLPSTFSPGACPTSNSQAEAPPPAHLFNWRGWEVGLSRGAPALGTLQAMAAPTLLSVVITTVKKLPGNPRAEYKNGEKDPQMCLR